MTGTVERYDRALCWGFVRGDDGQSYFVHWSEILGPWLTPGERVSFDPAESPRGPRAVGVRRLELREGGAAVARDS